MLGRATEQTTYKVQVALQRGDAITKTGGAGHLNLAVSASTIILSDVESCSNYLTILQFRSVVCKPRMMSVNGKLFSIASHLVEVS